MWCVLTEYGPASINDLVLIYTEVVFRASSNIQAKIHSKGKWPCFYVSKMEHFHSLNVKHASNAQVQ